VAGEIVNLRQVRKARARATATDQAAANRAKFGRSKVQKQSEAIDAERARRLLEGARREPGGETS
jgi:hypothetical protein